MPFIKAICLGNFADQSECLEFLLNELSPNLPPEKIDDLKEAVYLREDTASTYLDEGLAVPHGRIAGLDREYVLAGICESGVDWPTEDCRAKIIVLVAVDKKRVSAYLSILQKIIKWRKSLGNSFSGGDIESISRGLELALR